MEIEEYSKVKRNFIVIILEQLLTIKKELLHLKRICNFFSTEKECPYSDIYIDNNTRINTFLKKIRLTKEKLETISTEDSAFIFMVYIDRVQKDIGLILDGVKLINNSIRQHNEESFNAYMPKAHQGRRYSSKAISTFIRNYMKEVLDEYADNEDDIKALIVWTFRHGFKAEKTLNPKVIETAHYYYDLPYFIPNIFHELNHILFSLNTTSSKFQTYKDLDKSYKKAIGNQVKSAGLEINDEFPEEFISDLFAYDLLGPAYLFSCFYSISYSGMDYLFTSTESKQVSLVNFNLLVHNTQNEFRDKTSHVIEIHLRLRLLIRYALGDNTIDSDTKKDIKALENFLLLIFFTESEDEKSLYCQYKNSSELFLRSFDNLSKSINKSIQIFANYFRNHKEILFNGNIEYKKVFNEIWKEKLDNNNVVFHRNSLRKRILKEIFNDLEYEIFDYSAYELTFFKFRDNTEPRNVAIDDYFKNSTGFGLSEKSGTDYRQHECYGIYHNLAIRNKDKEVSIDKVRDFLDNDNKYNSNYYTYKIAMLKLYENKKSLGSNHGFGAIVQIQLINQDTETIKDGYETIFNILDKISVQYTIYKILGPNDYIVDLEYTSMASIFKLKDIFASNKYPIFRRTLTTIYELDDSKLIEDEKDVFDKTSDIRLQGNIDINSIKSCKINRDSVLSDYCKSIKYITGVQDIKICWNDGVDISIIIKKLEKYISDIQHNYELTL